MNISTLNKQHKLSKRYAVALFKLNDGNIKDDLKNILQTTTDNVDLKNFLLNTLIKTEEKKEVFDKVFGDIGQNTKNFISTLLDSKKFNYFETIVYEYTKLIDEKLNIKEADVVSPIKLTESEKARIKAKLENKFSSQFNINYNINENIISGLLIKVGDTLIDLSLKTKLNNLKQQIR